MAVAELDDNILSDGVGVEQYRDQRGREVQQAVFQAGKKDQFDLGHRGLSRCHILQLYVWINERLLSNEALYHPCRRSDCQSTSRLLLGQSRVVRTFKRPRLIILQYSSRVRLNSVCSRRTWGSRCLAWLKLESSSIVSSHNSRDDHCYHQTLQIVYITRCRERATSPLSQASKMAAAVKALNARIRSNPVTDYFCSTRESRLNPCSRRSTLEHGMSKSVRRRADNVAPVQTSGALHRTLAFR